MRMNNHPTPSVGCFVWKPRAGKETNTKKIPIFVPHRQNAATSMEFGNVTLSISECSRILGVVLVLFSSMTWGGGKTTSLHHEGIKISLRQLHNKKITSLPFIELLHHFWGVFGELIPRQTLKAQPKPGKEKLNFSPNNCPHFFSQGQSTSTMTDLNLCPKISSLLLPFHKEIGSKSSRSPFFFIPGHICSQIPAAASQWLHPCRARE